jgi:hypothetical protein
MMRASIVLLAALAAAAPAVSARAHSWYPKECCSNRDCMPAEAIVTNERGEKVVIVGHYRISIPRRLHARLSPDNRIHICFVVLEAEFSAPYALPLCLFLPAQS